jgi:hypothetical protein
MKVKGGRFNPAVASLVCSRGSVQFPPRGKEALGVVCIQDMQTHKNNIQDKQHT